MISSGPSIGSPRSAECMRTRKKQILERQGEVLLLRGWKSLKFGAEPSDAIGPGAGFPAICEGIELSIEPPSKYPGNAEVRST